MKDYCYYFFLFQMKQKEFQLNFNLQPIFFAECRICTIGGFVQVKSICYEYIYYIILGISKNANVTS